MESFLKSKDEDWAARLQTVIPGGAHTYSRGVDQFPNNAPAILQRGKGAYVWTPDGKKFLDLGMALRSTVLGYAYKQIDKVVKRYLRYGNNLTKPSVIELELAEKLVSTIPGMEMVKFAKHGSNVTTAACRVARSFTGKKYICVPKQQPFFAFEDWFIGKTVVNRGIPDEHAVYTLTFDYNDLDSLRLLFSSFPGQIAAVMMEPATHLLPSDCDCIFTYSNDGPKICEACRHSNFLLKVRQLCDEENSLLILDEMRTGFRWHLKGAQFMYGVVPDLATFGKALANGYSVSALLGKREIMSMASTNVPSQPRTFLLSSTHGAEMGPLAAANETLKILEVEEVPAYLWRISGELYDGFTKLIDYHSLNSYVLLEGTPLSLEIVCKNSDGGVDLSFKTLLFQELTKSNILISNGNSISLSYSHKGTDLKKFLNALDKALVVYKKALGSDIDSFLVGPPMKPVFRRYN